MVKVCYDIVWSVLEFASDLSMILENRETMTFILIISDN